MIVFPIQLQMDEETLGTDADVALALFCAEFSYLDFKDIDREIELRKCKNLGLHSIILKIKKCNVFEDGAPHIPIIKELVKTIQFCCKIKLFCILEIEELLFEQKNSISIADWLLRLSKPFFHSFGGRLLGIIATSDLLLKTLEEDKDSEHFFLWKRSAIGFHFFGYSPNRMSLQAKSIVFSSDFSKFLDSLLLGLEEKYNFFEFLNLQSELSKDNKLFLSIKEFIRSSQIYSDYHFQIARRVQAIQSPNLSRLDSISCILKRAKDIGLLFIRNKRKSFDFNSIAFSIQVEDGKSYEFPYELILSNEYALFPIAMRFGEDRIEYISVQMIYRFVGDKKEIWFCKEISGLNACISINGNIQNINVMQTNVFVLSNKILEVYCVSKFDNRFHQIMIYHEKPYLLLSKHDVIPLQEGFVLKSTQEKETICIYPNPNTLLSEFLNFIYNGKDFAVYILKNNYKNFNAKVYEVEEAIWGIEVPNAIIEFFLQSKNKIYTSGVFLQSVILEIHILGVGYIKIVGNNISVTQNFIQLYLEDYCFEDILELKIISTIIPKVNFVFLQGTTVQSKDSYPIKLR